MRRESFQWVRMRLFDSVRRETNGLGGWISLRLRFGRRQEPVLFDPVFAFVQTDASPDAIIQT